MRAFEGRTDVPLSPFYDKKVHEKEYFVPLLHGGEGRILVQFQIVYNKVNRSITQLEYYQSLRQGFEESAYEAADTVTTFKDMMETLYRPFPGLNAEKARVLGSIRPIPQNLFSVQSPAAGSGIRNSRAFGDISSVGGPIAATSFYNNRSANYSNMGPSQLMKPELREVNGEYVEAPVGNPQELSPFVKKTYKSKLYLKQLSILLSTTCIMSCGSYSWLVSWPVSTGQSSLLSWYQVHISSGTSSKRKALLKYDGCSTILCFSWLSF